MTPSYSSRPTCARLVRHLTSRLPGWLLLALLPLLARAGNPVLTLQPTGAGGTDITVFVDQVEIIDVSTNLVVASIVGDASFETVSSATFQYAPISGSAWSFGGNAGLTHNSGGFSSPNAPDGVQVAFLQTNTSNGRGLGSISQTLAGLPTGTYRVRLQAAQRNCCTATNNVYTQGALISINGSVIGNAVPANDGLFHSYTTTTSFTIGPPTISSFAPTSAPAGTSVTLTGTNLTGATGVTVNGKAATGVTVVDDTHLTFVVPTGASSTQSVTVTVPGTTSVASTAFTVLLTATAEAPAANALTAALANSALSVRFSETVAAAPALKVFSAQAGGLKAGTVTLNGTLVSYTSTLGTALKDFRPGELVSVTVPAGQTSTGLTSAPYVYQFTTATTPGSGTFAGASGYTTTNSAYGVAVGDVDGDGRLDIVTANLNTSGTVSVLLGLAGGGFGTKTDYPTGGPSYAVALGDMNGDGRLDIVTANGSAGSVSVLLGQAGGFAGSTSYTVGTATSVALGDVNGDGRLDIVTTSHQATGRVYVLLAQATSGYTLAYYPTANNPAGVALGDVNNDGRLDIVTANDSGTNSASVLLGQAGGSFGAPTNYPTGASPVSVALGDVNGDGRLDLVTANNNGTNTASVLLGQASGVFAAKTDYATGDSPASVALGDVNGDGRLDLVTANYLAGGVSVLLGQASGSFAAQVAYPNGSTPNAVALGDLNGDGRLDIVTAHYTSPGKAYVLLGLPPVPVIAATGLSPTQGVVGTSLTLTGTNFGGTTKITFTGTSNNVVTTGFTVNAAGTQITGIIVPSGATTGSLTVTTPSGTSAPSTQSFTLCQITAAVRPLTRPLNATSGAVTVNASAFNNGSTSTCGTVTLTAQKVVGGTATGSPAASLSYTCADVGTQSVLITLTDANGTTTTAPTSLTISTGTLTSLSPNPAVVGATVTASGAALNGTSALTVNGVSTTISNLTNTGFTFVVPAGATPTGNVVLTEPCGQTISSPFSVQPAISSFTPTSADAGNSLTLNGTGLSGATAITFSGTSNNVVTTGFTVNAAGTQITGVVVPSGATTGPLTVTTPSGTSAASATFTRCQLTVAVKNTTLALATNGSGTVNASAFNNGSSSTCGTITATAQKVGGTAEGIVSEGQTLTLTAPTGYVFSKVTFASYGDPSGSNGSYTQGSCHAPASQSLVEGLLLGQTGSINISADNLTFGGDPCSGVGKALAVVAVYTQGSPTTTLTYGCTDVGTQPVLVTLTDANGVKATALASVTVTATPTTTATLTGFSPATAAVGTPVTASGTNLSGATGLTVNGVAATISNLTNTGFTFTVPTGAASTGSVVVTLNTTPCGQTITRTFGVRPAISSIAPTSGSVGFTLTLNGTNFTQATSITFSGPSNNVVTTGFTVNAAGTQITGVVVPGGAITGPLTVTTPVGVSAASATFTVNPPVPVINSFSLSSGVAGTSVMISGVSLTGTSVVTVNGVNVTPTNVTATSLTFVVPAGASPIQRITATGPNGRGPANTTFTVLLQVTSSAPLANTNTAPVANSAVSLTFSEAVSTASVTSSGPVRVFSAQVGGRKPGTLTGGGSATINYTSTLPGNRANFKPGEVVSVTVPATVQNTGGLGAQPKVVQFTTAVSGTGRGNFVPPATGASVPVGNNPYSVATADVNGDGYLDLLTPNYTDQSVSVRYNDGMGHFTVPAASANAEIPLGFSAGGLVVGDLDGNGTIDLVAFDGSYGGTQVTIRLNNGTGTFTAPAAGASVAVGGVPYSLVLGDIDADGDLDLLTVYTDLNGDGIVSVRLNNGSGAFTAPAAATAAEVAVGSYARALALGDVDGNGTLDLLTTNKPGGPGLVTLRLNDGAGNFTAPATGATIAVGDDPIVLVLGDVDGNGTLDLLTGNLLGNSSYSNTVSVRLNNGSGSFTAPAVAAAAEVGVDDDPYTMVLSDLDADGDLDLLTSSYYGTNARFNNGTGTFTGTSTLALASIGGLAVGDVDGDGDLDLLTVGSANDVQVGLNEPGATLTSVAPNNVTIGQPITLTGTNLSSTTAVVFTEVASSYPTTVYALGFSSTSYTGATQTITLPVPYDLNSGDYTVQVLTGGPDSNALPLTVCDLEADFYVPVELDANGTAPVPATAFNPTSSCGALTTATVQRGGAVTDYVRDGRTMSLTAPPGYTFTAVEFASYGDPNYYNIGNDIFFSIGPCHDPTSRSVVENALLGKTGTVTIAVNGSTFMGGGCSYQNYLAVRAIYSAGSPASAVSYNCTELGSQPVLLTLATAAGARTTRTAYAGVSAPAPAASTTWTGTASTDWTDCRNWSYGQVPDANTSAMLPAGLPRYPSLPAGTFDANSLTIASGAGLTLDPGTIVQLQGDFTNNNATALAGEIRVLGSGAQALNTQSSLAQVLVDKPSGTLTLGRNLAIGTSLTLTNGVLGTGSYQVTLAPVATLLETITGYVTGTVQTTRDLSLVNTANAFGGLGLVLTPHNTGGAALPGSTLVRRITGTSPSGVGHLSVRRYFDIRPTKNSNLNVDFLFGYRDDELPSGLSESQLTLFKSATGASGTWTAQTTGTVRDATANTVAVPALPDFSLWTLSSAEAPLPVELVAFTARKQGAAVQLDWRTASEKDADRFEVERSSDGLAFAPIGTVAAKGTTPTPTDYAFADTKYPGSASQLYYRLRQVDKDGTAAYSPVRVVALDHEARLSLYPNPVHRAFAVLGAAPGTKLDVLDAVGRVVATATTDADGTAHLTLPTGLAAGVYVVRCGAQVQRLTVE
ncbi:MAG: FG-GAP-like repeat-containing protein [Janthinobacterium lividum]